MKTESCLPLSCAAKSIVFCGWRLELVSGRETCFNARYRELKNISFVPSKREPTMSTKGRNGELGRWKGPLKGRPLAGEHVLRQGSTHKGETSSSSFPPFPFSLYHFSFSRAQVRYFIIGTIRPLSWIIPRADKVAEYRRGCSIFLPWASPRFSFRVEFFLTIPLNPILFLLWLFRLYLK